MQQIPINLNTVLSDYAIELIRSKLINLSWLEYCMPAVQIGKNQTNNETYPEVYLGSGFESQKIIPDNNIKSFCFFEKLQSNIANEMNDLNDYEFNLFFWLNLQKINDKFQTDFYVKDVLLILQRLGCTDLRIDYNDIFQKYGIDYSQNQFFMFPYSKFKVNFKIKQYNKCK